MTVKIGTNSFSTKKPKDLDEALVAATGANATETARMMTGAPLASTVARALHPFLAESERPSVPELARQIEAAGVAEVARDVARLYGADAQRVTEPTGQGA